MHKAPFSYFGGKSMAAGLIWEALADPDIYIEPFCGSAAVLLNRSAPINRSKPRREIINDTNGYIVNFWRAVAAAPDDVAAWMAWPVHELDLHARHRWLVERTRKRLLAEQLRSDPFYYDSQVAGWWCWGAGMWIGQGWCLGEWDGEGSENSVGIGINKTKLPEITNSSGMHAAVRRELLLPKQIPSMSHDSATVGCNDDILRLWMIELSHRLRHVKVTCGDWKRVVTPCVLQAGGESRSNISVGVFLDPPYSANCDTGIYGESDNNISRDVAEWAIQTVKDYPAVRVVLAGYEGEHVMPSDWREVAWKARGGYGNISDGRGSVNRHRERLWCSPACGLGGRLF